MALVMRTEKHYGGSAWRHYDRAFRLEAEARDLRDWSTMKPDLYNYYTTQPFRQQSPRIAQPSPHQERQGDSRSRLFCLSWNQGSKERKRSPERQERSRESVPSKLHRMFPSLIIQTLHIAPSENGRERRV